MNESESVSELYCCMWTGLHEVFYSTSGMSACSYITGRDTTGPEHSGDQRDHC